MTDAITSVVIAIAIPLVFWWLARKYPSPELLKDGPGLEELGPKYRKWELVLVAVYIVLWLPVSAALYAPLHFVAEWRAHLMQTDSLTFVFYMDGAALWLPAFFMALLVSSVLLTPLLKIVLKERYAEFERYSALRHGFDQRRVMKGFSIAICAACALSVYAFFDAYLVASPGELRVNTLFGSERRYAYGDISEIVTAPALIAPNGNTVYRRVSVVKFKDGSAYSTDNMPEHELGDRSRADLIHFILRQSGLSPTEKVVFQRGEL